MELKDLDIDYDLRTELNESKNNKIYKNNDRELVKFLKYKAYKKGNECDKAVYKQISGKIYTLLWLDSKDDLEFVDGEIFNSVWTTLRKIFELCFEKFFEDKENQKKYDRLRYEFVLLFGGLSCRNFPICNIPNIGELKNYFSQREDEYYKIQNLPSFKGFGRTAINVFIEELLGKRTYTYKYCMRAKCWWIIDNIEEIEKVINSVDSGIFKKLEEFSKNAYKIGNLMMVPIGNNKGRSLVTADYSDLYLKSMYVNLGKDNFIMYADKFFLNMYLENNIPKMHWEGHSIKNKEIQTLEQANKFLDTINNYIVDRTKKMVDDISKKIEEQKENCNE